MSKLSRKPEIAPLCDDEEEVVCKYDKDGYGGDDDRKALVRMNEFDRKRLFADC